MMRGHEAEIAPDLNVVDVVLLHSLRLALRLRPIFLEKAKEMED
jgi:hypothetical protein